MPYLMIKVLTIRQLTKSLFLNNWALIQTEALPERRGRVGDAVILL